MKKDSLITAILVGVLTSLPVIAVTLLASLFFSLPPFPLDVFDWMARTLPGPVIAFGISSMVSVIRFLHLGPTATTAKLAEQIMGLLTTVLIGAVFGIYIYVVKRFRPAMLQILGLIGGVVLAFFMVYVEFTLGFLTNPFTTVIWALLVFIVWGQALGQVLSAPQSPVTITPTAADMPSPMNAPVDLKLQEPDPERLAEAPAGSRTVSLSTEAPSLGRREFIYLGGAAAASVVVSAIGLGGLRSIAAAEQASPNPSPSNLQPTPAAIPGYQAPAPRIALAAGTRPEITANADFYRIDIDVFPPVINSTDWNLKLDGLLNKPLTLTLDDIRSRTSVSQPLTMQCISNPVGGDLTGTTVWTGVPFKDILAEAGVQSGVVGFNIEAKDGFNEYIFLKDAMDPRTMLVYAMNGDPLPVEHGFPLRIYIPNRYGMKQPKWITHIEAMDHEVMGYWVVRGWDHDALIKTTSVIDAVDTDQMDPSTHVVPVGGIAWAGDRGISKVEIQVDSGPWEAAQLNNPPLSSLTWVQWRYDWKATAGNHTLNVRAYDNNGVVQESEMNPPEPSGATGIYSWYANVKG